MAGYPICQTNPPNQLKDRDTVTVQNVIGVRFNKPCSSFVAIFLIFTLEIEGLRDVFLENVEAGMASD